MAQTALYLAEAGSRVVTVHAPPDRRLALSEFIGLVVRQAPPELSGYDRLQCAFETLTRLEPSCTGAVLLVANAEMLKREVLEYLQLTCRSGRMFRLMLLGRQGLVEALAGAGLGWLREHIVVAPLAVRLDHARADGLD